MHDGGAAKAGSAADAAAAAGAPHPSDAGGIALEAVLEVGEDLGWGCTQALPPVPAPGSEPDQATQHASQHSQDTLGGLPEQGTTLHAACAAADDPAPGRTPPQHAARTSSAGAEDPSGLPSPSLQAALAAIDAAAAGDDDAGEAVVIHDSHSEEEWAATAPRQAHMQQQQQQSAPVQAPDSSRGAGVGVAPAEAGSAVERDCAAADAEDDALQVCVAMLRAAQQRCSLG